MPILPCQALVHSDEVDDEGWLLCLAGRPGRCWPMPNSPKFTFCLMVAGERVKQPYSS